MSADEKTAAPADTGRNDAEADDHVQVGVVLRRAAIALVAMILVLSVLGLVGRFFAFDSPIGDADEDIVQTLADNRVSVLDTAVPNIAALADTFTVLGLVVGATTMLWAAGRRRHAVTVVVALLLEFITFLTVGAIVDRARPAVAPLGSVPSTPSFPSGHTAASFVIYAVLVLVAISLAIRTVSKWIWIVPSTIAIAMAFARVYAGVHHPLDVLAGLLVGIGALIGAGLATGVLVVERSPFRLGVSTDRCPR